MNLRTSLPLASSLLVLGVFTFAGCSDEKASSDPHKNGGAGGESTASGGSAAHSSGGSGGEEALGGQGGEAGGTKTCAKAPASLGYWWDGERGDPELNYQTNEVVHGRHAEIVAPAGYGTGPGPVGTSLSFGVQVTAYSNSPVLDGPGPWPTTSLEFWLESYLGESHVVSWLGAWGVTLKDGHVRAFFEKKDADGEGPDVAATYEVLSKELLTTIPSLTEHHYYHVAVTTDVDALEARLYLNGKLSATLDFDAAIDLPTKEEKSSALAKILETASKSALEMGGKSAPFEQYMSGRIDEVSIYGEVLTPAEIKGIFDAGSLGKCPLE